MLKVTGFVVSLALLAAAAQAQPTKLTGAQITKLLSEHVLVSNKNGQETTQLFKSNGATFYSSGQAQQQGAWRVQGDKYCSVWPPSETVACYDVVVDGSAIRFVSEKGETSDWALRQ